MNLCAEHHGGEGRTQHGDNDHQQNGDEQNLPTVALSDGMRTTMRERHI